MSIELDLSPFGAPPAGLHRLVYINPEVQQSQLSALDNILLQNAPWQEGLQSHHGAVEPRAKAVGPVAAAVGQLATGLHLKQSAGQGQHAQQRQLLVERGSVAVHLLLEQGGGLWVKQ